MFLGASVSLYCLREMYTGCVRRLTIQRITVRKAWKCNVDRGRKDLVSKIAICIVIQQQRRVNHHHVKLREQQTGQKDHITYSP